MPTSRGFWGLALVAALLAQGAGCRSGSGPLVQVHGKVTFRGEPLRGGTIVFTPDADRGTSGELAYAEIQPDGTYTLKTGESAGAVAGWHRITVLAVEPPPGPPPPGQRYAIPASYLPLKYREPNHSGLSCEVKPDRANTIDIQLD